MNEKCRWHKGLRVQYAPMTMKQIVKRLCLLCLEVKVELHD